MLLEPWQTYLSEGKDFSDDDFVETPLAMHFYRQRIRGQVTDRLIGKKFGHGVLGRFYGQRDWDRKLFECGVAHRAGDAVDNENEVAGSEGLSEKHAVADVCQEREGGEVGPSHQWHMAAMAHDVESNDPTADGGHGAGPSAETEGIEGEGVAGTSSIERVRNNVITSSKCHTGFCKGGRG